MFLKMVDVNIHSTCTAIFHIKCSFFSLIISLIGSFYKVISVMPYHSRERKYIFFLKISM